MIQLKTNS